MDCAGSDGEVRRRRAPGGVCCASSIDADSSPPVDTFSTQKRAVYQRVAFGIQLQNECAAGLSYPFVAVVGLGGMHRREVARSGGSHHIGTSRAIHLNTVSPVGLVSSDDRRIINRLEVRAELGDEHMECGLAGRAEKLGLGKVLGGGGSGDVNIAGAISRDGPEAVVGRAHQELEHDGVDDERAGVIVIAKAEAYDVALTERHPARNLSAAGFKLLVDARARLADLTRRCVKYDSSVPVGFNGLRALETHADLRWIGAWSDYEIVLEAVARGALEHQVDTLVDLAILDAAGLWNAGVPLGRIVAHEVVAGAGLWIERLDRSGALGAGQAHAQLGGRQAEHGAVVPQK